VVRAHKGQMREELRDPKRRKRPHAVLQKGRGNSRATVGALGVNQKERGSRGDEYEGIHRVFSSF
jgi:hypothetical protein